MFLIIQIIIHDFDPCNIIHVQSALVNTNSGRPTQTVCYKSKFCIRSTNPFHCVHKYHMGTMALCLTVHVDKMHKLM